MKRCIAFLVMAVVAATAEPAAGQEPVGPWGRTLTLNLGKGVTMKFTLIPAGKFVMGAPETDKDRGRDEGPQHRVTMSRPFYIGVTEVTQAQYHAVTGKNPSKFKERRNPVERVTWDEATAFCEALSKKTGLTVRLPTEAEWEYACRAGSKTRYSFGNKDADLGPHAWYLGNSNRKPHPVGQKKPNAWGLYDMHGNVWEWCDDWYAGPYTNAKAVDPKGPPTGKERILRGASFADDLGGPRSARRGKAKPDRREPNYGFRVVLLSGLGLADLLTGIHAIRLPFADRVETVEGTVLKGTIRNKEFTITAPFGKIAIPAEKVAGIVAVRQPKTTTRPAVPRMCVIFTDADGQVVTGQMASGPILLETSGAAILKIPLARLRQTFAPRRFF